MFSFQFFQIFISALVGFPVQRGGNSGAAVMVLQTSDVDNVNNEDSQATPTIRARTLSLRGLQAASDADSDFRFAIESDRAGPQSTSRLSLRRFQRTLHHMSLPPALLMDIQGSFWRRYVPKILLSLACIIIYCEVNLCKKELSDEYCMHIHNNSGQRLILA